MSESFQTLEQRLGKLKENAEYFSDWEKGYLESVTAQWEKYQSLSPRQIELIVKIEEKISPESILASETWKALYREEKRNDALIVAKYYQKTGYFQDLVCSVLEDEEFIPSERRWNKMCNNKYALKVLAEHKATPKYTDAALVQLRAGADWRYRDAIGDTFCTVICSGHRAGDIVSAANGAKLYKILPFGSTTIFTVEERHIKKAKKLKKTKASKKVKKELDDEILF